MPEFTSSAIVEALYHALLSRAPDDVGLQDKTDRLDRKLLDLDGLVGEIVSSQEFLDRVPELLHRRGASGALRFTNDMSQHGEIWLLLRAWIADSAQGGVVVDVGARGRERSNSFDLLRELNWSGLLIEANPALIASIEQDFSGLKMKLLNCAVSDYEGRSAFTIGANDDVSSLDEGATRGWGDIRGQVTIEVRRLAPLLTEHGVSERFDLLSLDIEGHDVRVLNDLVGSSWYRPTWVIIEASDDFRVTSLDDAGFSSAVKGAYGLRAQTKSNLILKLTDETA